MDKEKSEVIQRLSEASRQSFDERRKYQWTVLPPVLSMVRTRPAVENEAHLHNTGSCLVSMQPLKHARIESDAWPHRRRNAPRKSGIYSGAVS